MNDIKQGGSNKPKGHVDFKSAFYFQTPIWIAEAPMFLKNATKLTDKYIKKADKLLKDKLKNEPKWKKDIGTFGLSKHSESFSNDPKVKDLVEFIGQRSYEFLDWQGFNLQNHSLHFTEFWVQEFSEKGGGHHSTHQHWNQHVSGFYFLKCSEKTSYPIFHEPRPGAEMTKLPLKNQSQITMGTNQVHYKPNPGTMIVFPGYVPHEFAVDAGIEPFRFIHWNIKVVETAISKERSQKDELQKNKYIVIKEAVPKEIATFVYNYFLLKRQVARTLFDNRYISNFTEEWGTWADQQVPNTYSHYADVAMETLLMRTLPVMEKKTGLKLNPTYSYARIYKTGDVLHRHKDRFSCEISTTLNLGGDPWPIHLEPKKNVGIPDGKKITVKSNNKGILVNLKPGDMLVYRGMELEHWREEFQGDNCAQVFLHYNDQKSKDAAQNVNDRRPHLGLPAWFKK